MAPEVVLEEVPEPPEEEEVEMPSDSTSLTEFWRVLFEDEAQVQFRRCPVVKTGPK